MYLLYLQTTLQQFSQVIIVVGVYTDDNKHVILTVLKTIHFNLTNKIDNSLKHATEYTVRHNDKKERKDINKLLFNT